MELSPEIAEWISTAMPDGTDTPCGSYNAATGSTCGDVPTRQFIGGRLCYTHAPRSHTYRDVK